MRPHILLISLILAGCGATNNRPAANTPKVDTPTPIMLIQQGEEPTVTLRVNLPENWTGEYVTKRTTDMQDAEIGNYTIIEEQAAKITAKEINDGNFTVDIATQKLDVRIQGNEEMEKRANSIEQAKQTVTASTRYDRLGRVLRTDISGKTPEGQQVSVTPSYTASLGFQGMLYPEDPVGPGGKWSSEMDFEKGLQSRGTATKVTGGKVPMTYELLSVDKQKNEARIRATLNADMTIAIPNRPGSPIPMKMNIEMVTRVALDTGLPLETQGKASTEATINGKKRVQIATIETRLKG